MASLAAITLLLCLVTAALADNLALLSGTLKTFQRASCNEELMTLKCPIGTAILVTVARYGRASLDSGTGKCSTTDPMISDNLLNTTCLWPAGLQHSLLQTVVEVCQKKRQCTFNTNQKVGDPCPEMPKYVEVLYKCRPYEFRSKVACENEAINLSCYPNYRVAIYSASFGRTEYESLQCPQPNGVKDETCMANHATEKVIDLCHGRRHCSIAANSSTFGDPCRPESRTYLKVVYTCVYRSVLREQYERGVTEPDETNPGLDSDEGFDRADFKVEFSPSPNLESPQFQPRDNINGSTSSRSGGVKSPASETSSPPRARINGDENQEKFYLYVIVSVTAGVLILLSLVIGRLLFSRHRAKRDAKFHANNETLPNGFTDDISEIDADIDLTTPVPVPMQDTRFDTVLPRLPETQLAERLHAERFYGGDTTRLPLSSASSMHSGHSTILSSSLLQHHHLPPINATTTPAGMRVDLGNHMVGTDNLHTILRTDAGRSGLGAGPKTSYYYG
ncbi:protein eva-1 homolog C isoform X1 [Trichogramma pretiosum]|uniref:protein eva-1 homolog C isoform X1 n=1 Tax=Trichogramma pretiosum TaxID=7493 RepID=UPI000C71AEF9|nr:protein eva-1 homolog C isoform X1 [Trichogramma pretiosum]